MRAVCSRLVSSPAPALVNVALEINQTREPIVPNLPYFTLIWPRFRIETLAKIKTRGIPWESARARFTLYTVEPMRAAALTIQCNTGESALARAIHRARDRRVRARPLELVSHCFRSPSQRAAILVRRSGNCFCPLLWAMAPVIA